MLAYAFSIDKLTSHAHSAIDARGGSALTSESNSACSARALLDGWASFACLSTVLLRHATCYYQAQQAAPAPTSSLCCAGAPSISWAASVGPSGCRRASTTSM